MGSEDSAARWAYSPLHVDALFGGASSSVSYHKLSENNQDSIKWGMEKTQLSLFTFL